MDMATDEGTVTDGVRNPMCGETPKPATCYSENRATLHLHGGITPWISDGTPHQWITPAGETTAYPKGVSVSNVPDMPDPGPGAETFFYTNQQSARLMFYHDHAWGITRLNVYAGEAARTCSPTTTEQSLIGAGGALEGLGLGDPLVIQDKTFVPSAATMAKVDPTWNSPSGAARATCGRRTSTCRHRTRATRPGMSAFGRWMYGPWFWPPAKNAKYPPIANPYYDPTCDPDVQPFCEPAQIPSTPNVSVGMEAFNDTPDRQRHRLPDHHGRSRRPTATGSSTRPTTASGTCPGTSPTRTGTRGRPEARGGRGRPDRPGRLPDTGHHQEPKGPDWIQIGTEGGFLPAPVVVPAHETTWITDPTRFDVGNVDQHSLLLAPAERADVVVDFSQYRGKTLILYNDAPAAFPARVPGYDYYTGGPDLTPRAPRPRCPATARTPAPSCRSRCPPPTRHSPSTGRTPPPTGWARSWRRSRTTSTPHGKPAGVFESGSDPIIVGQAAYNSAYGTQLRGQRLLQQPDQPDRQVRRLRPDQPAGRRPVQVRHPRPEQDGTGAQLGFPCNPRASMTR